MNKTINNNYFIIYIYILKRRIQCIDLIYVYMCVYNIYLV